MIVTECNDEILLFDQHDHARVCGELASLWREEFFLGLEKRESVIYAIYEHDNGWIELDQIPLVNQETQVPYSFINYPLAPKLKAYTTCINRVEQNDSYAALICSLHYASFFENYTNGRGEGFLAQERERQEKIKSRLQIDEVALNFHYSLLQFCDNLSLYLCMNEPGVSKKDEFIWFRRGFSQKFYYNNNRKLIAHWLDKHTVSLSDFPFKEEVSMSLNYKAIKKNRLHFLEQEFIESEIQQRVVKIVKG